MGETVDPGGMRSPLREQWTLADPDATLPLILEAGAAQIGRTIVALVDPGTQEVRGVGTMDTPPVPPIGELSDRADQERRSSLRKALSDIACDLGSQWQKPPDSRGELYTVVCRDGRVVVTDTEWQFFVEWLYCHHGTGAISADVYVVTPHGWTGIWDQRAGFDPRLSARRKLTLVEDSATPTIEGDAGDALK